jgi:hypothetical protein
LTAKTTAKIATTGIELAIVFGRHPRFLARQITSRVSFFCRAANITTQHNNAQTSASTTNNHRQRQSYNAAACLPYLAAVSIAFIA